MQTTIFTASIIFAVIAVALGIKRTIVYSNLDSMGIDNKKKCEEYYYICTIINSLIVIILTALAVITFLQDNKSVTVLFILMIMFKVFSVQSKLQILMSIKGEASQEIFTTKITDCKIKRRVGVYSNTFVTGKSLNYGEESLNIYGRKTIKIIKRLIKNNNSHLIISYYSESQRIISIEFSESET